MSQRWNNCNCRLRLHDVQTEGKVQQPCVKWAVWEGLWTSCSTSSLVVVFLKICWNMTQSFREVSSSCSSPLLTPWSLWRSSGAATETDAWTTSMLRLLPQVSASPVPAWLHVCRRCIQETGGASLTACRPRAQTQLICSPPAGLVCNRTFDLYACWPDGLPGTTVNVSCPWFLPWYHKGLCKCVFLQCV